MSGARTVWVDPAALTEFDRLWTTTPMSSADIAAYLNERFGMKLNADRLNDHADRRGLRRFAGLRAGKVLLSPSMRMERAFIKRLNPPPREDNPVRKVAPGTFRVRGFTMIGGRA